MCSDRKYFSISFPDISKIKTGELLIFPFALSTYINNAYGLLIALIFIIIVTIGFIFELGKGALKISTKQNMEDNSNKKNIISISYLNRIIKTK